MQIAYANFVLKYAKNAQKAVRQWKTMRKWLGVLKYAANAPKTAEQWLSGSCGQGAYVPFEVAGH